MGFVMPHVTVLMATGVAGLALIFQIVGLATPNWIVIRTGNILANIGLWKVCSGLQCTTYTQGPFEVDAFIQACRAFGILGVLAIAGSVLCGVLICIMSEQKNTFFITAPVAAGAGALFVLIEFAVFAGEFNALSNYFDYSFALTVVAFCFCIGASLLFFVGRSQSAA